MELKHGAVAGTLESSDIMITIHPGTDGVKIDLTSSVAAYYGDSIRAMIQKVLAEMGVENAVVKAVDHGALDCTIRGTDDHRRPASCERGGCTMRRTMLFLPSNNPNMLINGGQLGADSLIFDLEDAVSPDEKDAARELLKNTLESLDFGKCERIVRINGLDTDYWMEDLRAILPLRPETIMPPKVSGAAYIHQLDEALTALEAELGIPSGSTKILALLETAAGIENAYEVACASPRMTGLFLGAEDLTADLHSRRTKEGSEILYARGRIVCAARAAGMRVYDTPFTDVPGLGRS